MSGGVGPTCGDISLPKEEEEQHMKLTSDNDVNKPLHPDNNNKNNKRRTFLSFRQLNALAIIIVLSASGMVSLQDFTFLVFSTLYMFVLSKLAFPTLPNTSTAPPIFDSPKLNKLLSLHTLLGAALGLLLPILYIFSGIFCGDKQGIRAAAPHVFLLASQIFMEGLAFSSRFSIPITVFVPVCYNSMRLFALMEWLDSEIGKVDVADGGSMRRVMVGRGLAVANLAFWGFNLFGFLLPIYMPRVLRRYYSDVFKVKD
uniref:DUF7733 domain-containing protein n=1 Tax=Kalanchoe fedtschenkoi TaxID=63787 RepID=A0A7N0U6L5_KALFE